ncbi:MAG: alpha/beta hydrolase [Oleibacter sp.]|nr:alpha/beta hydrolase [Thalassolituus sp.]
MSHVVKHRFLRGLDCLLRNIPDVFLFSPVNDRGERLDGFLQVLRKLRGSQKSADVQTIRAGFARDMKAMRHGYPISDVKDFTVAGCAVRLYRPANAQPVTALYFHGGGFVMGDLETHDDACRLLAEKSGVSLLAVNYRFAPEHPIPAAIEDAENVLIWAIENLTGQSIAVAGDSAGANLAAVLCRRAAEKNIPLLAQLLMYPGTDMITPRDSHSLFAEGYFLNKAERDIFYSSYLPAGADRHAADISPLLHRVPEGIAPAITVTAGFDMLRDEGMAYANQMYHTNRASKHLHFGTLGHAFINMAGVHKASEQALCDIAVEWRVLLDQQLAKQSATRPATHPSKQ